jgi:hypothetical protein
VFRTEGGALATPLPFEARLRPESRAIFGTDDSMFPGLEGNSPGEQRYTEPMPIALICLLKRVATLPDDRPAIVRPVSPVEAFPELLIHAHEFDPYDPDRRARMMQTYLDLAALVPVVEVSFVPDRSRLESLLDTIIDGLSLSVPDAADATQSV